MKKIMGGLMVVLGVSAFAGETTMDVPVRANLVKPLKVEKDGVFSGQAFLNGEGGVPKSIVNLSVKGKGNETVEVIIPRSIDLSDGESGSVRYNFIVHGSNSVNDNKSTRSIIVLDGTGSGGLSVEGQPRAEDLGVVGTYIGDVTVRVSYL